MNLPKIVNSIGLGFDIFGAWFVAWEVVRQYEGRQYGSESLLHMRLDAPSAEKTPEFLKWEINKYRRMKIGLALLTIGFVLQIGANWL